MNPLQLAATRFELEMLRSFVDWRATRARISRVKWYEYVFLAAYSLIALWYAIWVFLGVLQGAYWFILFMWVLIVVAYTWMILRRRKDHRADVDALSAALEEYEAARTRAAADGYVEPEEEGSRF